MEAPDPLFTDGQRGQPMENDGLVRRTEYLEVPVRVEYELTEKAQTLQPILQQLIQWQASEA